MATQPTLAPLPPAPPAERPKILKWSADAYAADAYANSVSGIGYSGQDRTLAGVAVVDWTSGTEAETIWRGSALGGRCVEVVPREMTRSGLAVSIQPTEDEDLDGVEVAKKIDRELKRLNFAAAARQALEYERAYGGGAILLGVDDGLPGLPRRADEGHEGELVTDAAPAPPGAAVLAAADPRNLTAPLSLEALQRVTHLTVLQGGADGELTAWRWQSDPLRPHYGEVEIWQLNTFVSPSSGMLAPGERPRQIPRSVRTTYWIHASRLLIFPGKNTGQRSREQLRGWSDSIFTRLKRNLGWTEQSWGALAILMSELSIGVLKTEGLAEAASSQLPDEQSAVRARVVALNYARSVARTWHIDASESFERHSAALGGVADTMREFLVALAAVSEMPLSLLLGQTIGGLGDTQEGDQRWWESTIGSKQSDAYLPAAERLVELILRARRGPTGGVVPSEWSVTAKPLRPMTDQERANLRKTVAETDQIHYGLGAISGEEVRRSRYGGAEWSMETTIEAEETTPAAEGETPEIPGQGAPPVGASEATKPGGIDLTSTAQGAIVTVNEARAQLGLPPLATATGAPDPDGALTIAVFTAHRASTIATAAAAEAGEAPGAAPVVPPAS